SPLPETRWALTPPFHPYLADAFGASARRSVLCCTFLGVSATGRYPASRSVELGLSSRLGASRPATGDRLYGADGGRMGSPARFRKSVRRGSRGRSALELAGAAVRARRLRRSHEREHRHERD